MTVKTTLIVEGMSCGHCVKAVEENVGKLSGVNAVSVNLAEKQVTIDYDDNQIQLKQITETIEDQGYDVKN